VKNAKAKLPLMSLRRTKSWSNLKTRLGADVAISKRDCFTPFAM